MILRGWQIFSKNQTSFPSIKKELSRHHIHDGSLRTHCSICFVATLAPCKHDGGDSCWTNCRRIWSCVVLHCLQCWLRYMHDWLRFGGWSCRTRGRTSRHGLFRCPRQLHGRLYHCWFDCTCRSNSLEKPV